MSNEPITPTDEPPVPAPAPAFEVSAVDLPTQPSAPEPAVVAAAPALDPAAVGALLKQHFPALFGGAPKPIKLQIQADIRARAPGVFSKRALSAFLHRHTGSSSYLIGLCKSTQRFDLDGQPAGELSVEHRELAAQELARRRELQNQRRIQEEHQRELEARQRSNRAGLLRDFERTTLTPANFCVLKGVAIDELDGLLEIATRERAEEPPRPLQAPRDDARAPRRGDDGRPRPPGTDRPQRPPGADRSRRPPTERR